MGSENRIEGETKDRAKGESLGEREEKEREEEKGRRRERERGRRGKRAVSRGRTSSECEQDCSRTDTWDVFPLLWSCR